MILLGRSEPPAALTSDDHDLPEGWAMARVQDYFDSWGGMTPATSKPAYWGGNVPWISSKDVKQPRLRQGTEFVTDLALRETRLRLCPPGTVLVVVRSGILAHTLPVTSTDAEVVINQDLKAFNSQDVDLNEWLALALRAKAQAILADSRKDGTTVHSIEFPRLKALAIPLPPLAEQKRIVEKVEALLAQVDASRARLAKVPAILKRFRQAVLAAACSGRLTDDWRDASPDRVHAIELLERIKSARGQAIRHHAAGRRLPRSADDESMEVSQAKRPDLPEEWAWTPLTEILHFSRSAGYGVLQPGPNVEDGVPMVRVCDLSGGTVLVGQLKRIAPAIDEQYRRTRLKGGEVLVSLVGTVGRTAVAPSGAVGANIARAVAMLPVCDDVHPRFLQLCLAEPSRNAELIDLAREVARKTLNLGLLKGVWVPFPSLAEQQEIVRRVEALFKLADAIERRVGQATARAERLTQAVLAKAFRGELVPTEAELSRRERREYEPASVLLERIRHERAHGTVEQIPTGRSRRGARVIDQLKLWEADPSARPLG